MICFVFDVESIGLHGEGFAVGYIVIDSLTHIPLDSGRFACNPDSAIGTETGRDWVKANCPALTITHDNPEQVRFAFWQKWLEWKTKEGIMFAECAWPVEARFLAATIDDNHTEREWEGPYPLHDIASIRLAIGVINVLESCLRYEAELPIHDPLADARQSARLLIEALHKLWKA